MPSFRTGVVHEVLSARRGLQRVTVDLGSGPERAYVLTQLVGEVDAGNRVVAVDGDTGKEIWSHTTTGQVQNRGVGYWPGDGTNPPRILYTIDSTMYALNANTGAIDPGFGREGKVNVEIQWGGVP